MFSYRYTGNAPLIAAVAELDRLRLGAHNGRRTLPAAAPNSATSPKPAGFAIVRSLAEAFLGLPLISVTLLAALSSVAHSQRHDPLLAFPAPC